MSTDTSGREALFRQLADRLSHGDARVTRSTMMGFPCLRVDGKFFACIERATGNLILKLSAERVNDLVRTGSGRPFAPNGHVFKEWVACPAPPRESWTDLLNEAKRYVDCVTANLRRQMEQAPRRDAELRAQARSAQAATRLFQGCRWGAAEPRAQQRKQLGTSRGERELGASRRRWHRQLTMITAATNAR